MNMTIYPVCFDPGAFARRSLLPLHPCAILIAPFLAMMVAGCGSAPPKSGGYYLDDGPGASAPANLDSIPEPTPRAEPINRYTSRPYTVLGRTYVPYERPIPYKAKGFASWYGKRYQGKKTASGEIYDMYAMSAAHTLLALPSYARVTNVATGKAVVVRVNDRGPFLEGRLIDLSYAAAHRIGLIGRGSGLVEVEAILPGEDYSATPAAATPGTSMPADASDGIYLQLGAFSVRENADAFLRKMQTELAWLSASMSIHGHDGYYRVRAGPYSSREQAGRTAARVQEESGIKTLLLEP